VSGVRQGCILSPLLFSIFLSELQVQFDACGARGIDTFADPVGILMLMYADDIAIVSDSVSDLQKKINCLEMYCKKWGLTVNMSKTNVVVFKNGGFVKNIERWWFGDKQIEVVPWYCYLGIIFSAPLNWSRCTDNLSGKALRAVAGVKRLYYKLRNLPAQTVFKIFDAKVKPILLYGSEIWGFRPCDDIEKVQVKVCKMVLGVGRDVRNSFALGECGRYPIYIDTYTRVVKYWCRLITMSEDRYPRQCYNMLCMQDKSGRSNWVTKVKALLCTYGFGYIWVMQAVGDVNGFIRAFTCRLKDCARQEWHDSVATACPEFCFYNPDLIQAHYIDQFNAYEHRHICLLRCGQPPLNGISRFGQPIDNPECKQCGMHHVEDLCHFLLVCPKYLVLRKRYIPLYYYRFPSTFKVQLLCNNLTKRNAFKIATYVTECFKQRD
jgi:hypothetical protein